MAVDDLIARVEKHYKRPILKRAGDSSSPFQLRRPTGIVSLDVAMGGGWPAGGVSEIAALPGIGKNALCNQTIRWCQRLYKEETCVAWITLELSGYDKPHAHICGVQVSMSDYELELENLSRKKQGRPALSKSQTAKRKNQIGEFLIASEGSTAERLQAAVELVQDNQCQLVIIDSLAAFVSKARDDTDLDDEPQQSAEARLATEFQKKLWSAYCNPTNGKINLTTVLAINQVRANRLKRGPFDRAWTVPGAYAIRHGKLVDVVLQPGNSIFVTPSGKETAKGDKVNTKIGKFINWKIEKGKAGCHEGPSGEVPYYFSYGFDIYQDLITTARSVGVIQQKGDTYKLLDHDGEVIASGNGDTKELIEMVSSSPKVFDSVYWLIVRQSGLKCVHKL